jgi:hypothetical protein
VIGVFVVKEKKMKKMKKMKKKENFSSLDKFEFNGLMG